MKTDDSEMQRQSFIRQHRWVFNLLWWIGMMILGLIVLFSPISEFIASAGFSLFGRHWYVWFFGIFGPALIIQAILHWHILNFLFPSRRRGNLMWFFFMPVLLLIGYTVAAGILFAIAVTQLGD